MANGSVMSLAAKLAETNPFLWKLAWEATCRLPFLLPHDKSYYALRHFIKATPNGLFLDIGANDGISVRSFRKLDKDYSILCLEPNLLLEPKLRRIQLSDPHMSYRMVGAGSRTGSARFFVPCYRGIALHTFTAADENQVRLAVASCFGDSVAEKTEFVTVESEIIRGDDLHVDPTIIKIDAEGFDYAVLAGLCDTIARCRPYIMVEVTLDENDQISKLLTQFGYCLLSYDRNSDVFDSEAESYPARETGHRNMFAIPNEKRAQVPIRKTRELIVPTPD